MFIPHEGKGHNASYLMPDKAFAVYINYIKLIMGILNSKIRYMFFYSYSDIYGVLGYLLSRTVNVEAKVLQSDYKEIIPGRGGDIVAGDMIIGIIGERLEVNNVLPYKIWI